MPAIPPLQLSADDRRALKEIGQSSSATSPRAARQAAALLLSAEGLPSREIAERLGVSAKTVRSWRLAFDHDGIAIVGRIGKGRGRKPSVSDELSKEVVRVTLHEQPPKMGSRWTTRSLARHLGISKDSVARIWAEQALAPWRTNELEVPHAPAAKPLTVDLLGLHFDPPIGLAVFTVDRIPSTVESGSVPDEVADRRHSPEERTSALARIAVALEAGGQAQPHAERDASSPFIELLRFAERKRAPGMGIHVLVTDATTSLVPGAAAWLAVHEVPPWYPHPSVTIDQWRRQVLQWLARMDEGGDSTTATIIAAASAIPAFEASQLKGHGPFHWTQEGQLASATATATPTGDEVGSGREGWPTQAGGMSSPEVVAEKLRSAILHGELAPGEHVRQPQWAKRLGVSRAVLREAFKMLAGQHLLRHHPQSGYFVARFSESEMRQLYRLTAIVEEDIFRHIRWPSQRELAVLEQQFDDYQSTFLRGDISATIGYWRQYLFHLYSLSSETFLVAEGKRLWTIATPYRMIVLATMVLQDPDLIEIREARTNQMRALRAHDLDAFIRSIIHDRLPAFERYATHKAIVAFFRKETEL